MFAAIHYGVMKTAFIIFASAFILSPLNCAYAQSQRSLFARLFTAPTWSEVVESAGSPSRICKIVRRQISYREDMGDVWVSGRTAWRRGYGDCEDIAIAVMSLCRQSGLDKSARVVVLKKSNSWEAHAVVIGRWQGGMWFSSNGLYQKVDSLQDAASRVCRKFRWEGACEILPYKQSERLILASK